MVPCQIYCIEMANFNIRNVTDRVELMLELQRFAKYVQTIFLNPNDIRIESFVETAGIVYNADQYNFEEAGEEGGIVIVNKIYHVPNVAC